MDMMDTTEDQLTLFAEESPVSHFQSQVSKEVRMILDTYGRTTSGSSNKLDPLGRLSRMLVDSSAWHSMMCVLTWNLKTTPSNRLLFQLSAKKRDISEIECGLWPTPRANESTESIETIMARRNRTGIGYINLTAATQMWPTPQASDGSRGPCKPEDIEITAGGFSRTVRDGTRFGATLVSAANASMFPTPSANEDAAGTPKGNMQRMLGNCEEVRGKTPDDWAKGTLNPDWVEALMGYPVGWTDLTVDDVTHELSEWVGDPDDSGKPRATTRKDGRVQRLKQLGNSIVPQVASEIFKAIKAVS